MGKSFSKIKKELETEWLAEKLKGQVKYNLTRYRKSHDSWYGRIEIWLDDRLILNSADISAVIKHGYHYQHSSEMIEAGDLFTDDFYRFYYEYTNSSIEESINSDNALVRLFAIFDRRLGKNRLKEHKDILISNCEWLIPFYEFRYNAEFNNRSEL